MTDTITGQSLPAGEAKQGLRGLPRNVWVLTLTSFFTDVSSDMLVNLIPLFLYNVLGVQTSLVGLIDGIAETTASLTKVFSGALSDRLGKRKGLTVFGYSLSSLSKPFLYLAASWGWVLAVRFSDRLGKGIRNAPRDALLVADVDPRRRGLAFGVQRAGDTAGAFLGVFIAGFIIWKTQQNAEVLTRETFQWVVLASILPALLAVAVLWIGSREVSAAPKKSTLPSFSVKGFDRHFLLYLGAAVLFTLGNSSDSFIILRGQERGLSVLQVMGMLLTFNAVSAILAGPLGSLSDRVGKRKMILAGWLIYAVIYLGFALSKTGTGIWALFGIYGAYYAMTEGIGKAFIADLVPEEKRGTAYGLYATAVGLTALPASLAAGILWQGVGSWVGFGPAAPFYFGAALSLVAVGFFAVSVRE